MLGTAGIYRSQTICFVMHITMAFRPKTLAAT